MQPDDLFYWQGDERCFKVDLVDGVRRGSNPHVEDLDVAYAMARLARGELRAYLQGNWRLSDDDLDLLLRALRSALRRLGISFDPPFRDHRDFDSWLNDPLLSFATSTDQRLTDLFEPILAQLVERQEAPDGDGAIWGVDGEMKNIIFAGPKPRIVLRDAINNRIDIVEGVDDVLFYDRPFGKEGVAWGDLVAWWRNVKSMDGTVSESKVALDLHRRLAASLDSKVEGIVLSAYARSFLVGVKGPGRPALIPQVWLHYDPMTRRQRRKLNKGDVLERERMDFLMLLPRGVRIVIEVDGRHHFADDDGKASTRRYADMVAEDRRLRLDGYEVYRFGGLELSGDEAAAHALVRQFFADLLTRHRLIEASA